MFQIFWSKKQLAYGWAWSSECRFVSSIYLLKSGSAKVRDSIRAESTVAFSKFEFLTLKSLDNHNPWDVLYPDILQIRSEERLNENSKFVAVAERLVLILEVVYKI